MESEVSSTTDPVIIDGQKQPAQATLCDDSGNLLIITEGQILAIADDEEPESFVYLILDDCANLVPVSEDLMLLLGLEDGTRTMIVYDQDDVYTVLDNRQSNSNILQQIDEDLTVELEAIEEEIEMFYDGLVGRGLLPQIFDE